MRSPLSLFAILLAACGSSPPGQADAPVATVDAAPRQRVMETKTLLAGQLLEGTWTGGTADRATFHLVAPSPHLDWNIHGHAGGGTQTVKEAYAQTVADDAFVPPAAGDWFFIIRNSGTAPMDVQAEMELYGELTWVDWK
jgi:hypothetical protein